MKVSPLAVTWLVFITTVFQGLAGGTVHLSGLIPSEWVPFATAWLNLIVFVNLSFLTVFVGYIGPGVGPLSKPPTMDEARKIMDQAAHPGADK